MARAIAQDKASRDCLTGLGAPGAGRALRRLRRVGILANAGRRNLQKICGFSLTDNVNPLCFDSRESGLALMRGWCSSRLRVEPILVRFE